MVTIREATADDFEKVYPLLLGLPNPYLSKEQWRQLFVDHSGCQEGRFGYVLFDGDEAVGFLGTTFAERTVRGEKARLCNMSNWIVKSAYRGHSLSLLAKVLALRNVTITNLSPTPQVLKVCEKMGFSPMDKSERIVVPMPTRCVLFNSCTVLTERSEIERVLGGEQLKIFREHRLPHNHHALIRSSDGDCYVMMNRAPKTVTGRIRLPFGRVHHISALDVFLKHLGRLVLTAVTDLRVVALIVDERALRGHRIWHSFARPGGPRTGAFRSDRLTADDIDGLYSEMVLLNY